MPSSLSRPRSWPAWLLAAVLAAYIVYPLGALLAESWTRPVAAFRAEQAGWDPGAQPRGAAWTLAARDAIVGAAAWGTFSLAALTVLLGGAWGLALALFWHRTEFPGRRFFAALGYAPIVLPPLVGTLAFFRIVGEGGWLWNLPFAGERPLSPFARVVLVHIYSFGVYTYAYCSAALRGADPSREEAARSLGARGWAVFRAAQWPVLRGPLLAAALLTYMAAAASFSAPWVLDNTGRYLTVEIFRNENDAGMQRMLGVLLGMLALAALPPYLLAFRQRDDLGAGLRGATRAVLRQARPPEAAVRIAVSVLLGVILLAPPLAVLHAALLAAPGAEHASRGALAAVLQLGSSEWAALGRSVAYGAITAGIDLMLALGIAWVLRRSTRWAGWAVEFPVMLALALPPSVVAVALLSAFNGPSLLFGGAALGGTAGILILAYFVRTLPLAVRPLRAALAALGEELEQAAASLGARPRAVFARVVLPRLSPVLLSAGLLCFVTAAGEFVASQLLFDTSTRPASVLIAENFRSDPGTAFALALCLMVLSAAAIGVSTWLDARSGP